MFRLLVDRKVPDMRDRNDRLPEAPSCEVEENIGMPEDGRPRLSA